MQMNQQVSYLKKTLFLKTSYGFGMLLLLCLLLSTACNNQAKKQDATSQPVAAQTNRYNSDQPSTAAATQPFSVVNWNIEWLGSTSNGPKDKKAQLANAIKILRYLKADLYCLCEIVDPAALRQLAEGLGKDYGYLVSDYGSGAKTTRDPGYSTTQKLAFIYNKNRVKDIHTEAYLAENPRVGYYFASGRYPFELSATIGSADGAQKVHFMIIHAKSGADKASYDRRLQGALALKAALDQNSSDQLVMLLGDFNDHMQGSITSGKPSPYQAFVEDKDYQVLTLPLSSQRSTLHYQGVIDHQIISGALSKFYIAGSTKIRTDITDVVPSYTKGGTSDHYPVSSDFRFDQHLNGTSAVANTQTSKPAKHNPVTASTAGAVAESVPATTKNFTATVKKGSIIIKSAEKSEGIQFILYNQRHNKVLSVHRKYILKGDEFTLRTPDLYKGSYSLHILSNLGQQEIAFSIQ